MIAADWPPTAGGSPVLQCCVVRRCGTDYLIRFAKWKINNIAVLQKDVMRIVNQDCEKKRKCKDLFCNGK